MGTVTSKREACLVSDYRVVVNPFTQSDVLHELHMGKIDLSEAMRRMHHLECVKMERSQLVVCKS